MKKEKGQRTESDQPTEEIEPEPAFVIKTVDKKSGTKVFLNVCGSDKVPAPGDWSNGQMPADVQKALEDRDGDGSAEALRFPLSAGQAKKEEDKKGEPCVAIDCILNADVLGQAAQFRPLKQFLIELAIGWVSHKASMDLDVKYKLPKMRYKGDVVSSSGMQDSSCRGNPGFDIRLPPARAPALPLRSRSRISVLTASPWSARSRTCPTSPTSRC